jgi:hypothetical protein
MFRRFLIFGLLMQVLCVPNAARAQTPPSDPKCKDLEILKAEALNNEPKALFELAVMYNKGECVPQSLEKGAQLMGTSGMVLGYPPALYIDAAALHQNDRDDIALQLALKAARQGHVDAQTLVSYLYSSGKGIVNDDDESAKWAKRAAEQGDAVGQAMIGASYVEGIGVKKDLIEANKWLILAIRSKLNDNELITRQKALEAQLSKSDSIEAHRRADAWKAKPEPHNW